MYRLHGFCQSGNTFKVAFCLRALHQPYETVFVDFMHGRTRDPAWRAETNEMGEAPVLDDGSKRLTQSGAILTHLAHDIDFGTPAVPLPAGVELGYDGLVFDIS